MIYICSGHMGLANSRRRYRAKVWRREAHLGARRISGHLLPDAHVPSCVLKRRQDDDCSRVDSLAVGVIIYN